MVLLFPVSVGCTFAMEAWQHAGDGNESQKNDAIVSTGRTVVLLDSNCVIVAVKIPQRVTGRFLSIRMFSIFPAAVGLAG